MGEDEEQALDLTNLARDLDEVMMAASATAPDMDVTNGAVGEAGAEGNGKIWSKISVTWSFQITHRLIADVVMKETGDEGIVIDEKLFMEDVQVDEELFDVEGVELEVDSPDDDGDSDDHSQD